MCYLTLAHHSKFSDTLSLLTLTVHVASIQGGTENPTADYEEINDEMCTEMSPLEKLQLEANCKSLELTKSSNHSFTLTEQPPPVPEEHESISNVNFKNVHCIQSNSRIVPVFTHNIHTVSESGS